MKKTIIALALLLFILFSVFASAKMCNIKAIKRTIKKALQEYFRSPATARLSITEIRDLLAFYLSVQSGQTLIECSLQGNNSGIDIDDLINKQDNTSISISKCSEGTVYGRCSMNKPKYCNQGNLIEECDRCGCPRENVCTPSKKCVKSETAMPDLVIVDFDEEYSGVVNTGIKLTASILNNGTAPTEGNLCDSFYVETQNGRGFCGSTPLQPGEKKTIESIYVLPAPGTYQIRVDADYGRQINESNENNNRKYNSITVTSNYSDEYVKANTDLTITDIDVQLPNSSSQYTKIYVTTKNAGNLSVGGYWVYTKVTNTDTDKVTKVQRLAPLVEASQIYKTYHGSVGITSYGTYKVEAFVDLDLYGRSFVNESNEDNNYMVKTVSYSNQTDEICTDSDGGIDYYAKGTMTNYTGINLTDYCYIQKTLIEYDCSRGAVYYDCPDGCGDGACIKNVSGACIVRYTSSIPPTASQPDLGAGYAKKHITGVNTFGGLQAACTETVFTSLLTDYCTINNETPQYAIATYKPDGNMYAWGSCSLCGDLHPCDEVWNQTCTETDSGFDIYSYGNTTVSKTSGSTTYYDICLNSTALTESYCQDKHEEKVNVTCPVICQDGACV